jgi:hypothetical protein
MGKTINPDIFRSEEGLRKGGHSRPEGSTVWGSNAFIAPTQGKDPRGAASHTVIGSRAPKPLTPLQPAANEASPKGEKAAGAPTPRVASSPPGMIGRRK